MGATFTNSSSGTPAAARRPSPGAPTNTVLLVTDNVTRAADISAHLERLNFEVKGCMFDGERLNGAPKMPPSVILVALTDFIERAPTLVEGLKNHYAPREIPVLGTLSRKADIDLSHFESVIYPPAHASQIANRTESLVRLSGMEQEIIRRIQTLDKDFGIEYTMTEDALSKPFKVLFVGKPTAEFMVVINALQEKGVDVVAAFTTFSAFDYLYETQFNAVVLNALEDVEPQLTIASTMRRNAKLYHVPTLLLVNGKTFTHHERAFKKGARDLIDANADLEEISGRILELANYHRIHSQLKREFGEIGGARCIDEASGTFNSEFFYAHLKRVCDDLTPQENPVSLIAIKVWPNAPFAVSSEEFTAACAQVGSMIKSLVRMQDIVARIENNVFIVALPHETENSLRPVVERISAIVDCAAFATNENKQGPFTVELVVKDAEFTSGDTSDLLIGRVLSKVRDGDLGDRKAG